jgi:hopanoid biosynthesis associated RND transporter like protein HpnN
VKPEPSATIATGRLARFATWVTAGACRHPGRALLIALVAALVSLAVVWNGFALDTDVARLFSPNLPWRQTEDAMSAAFPGREDLIAVVIDGETGDVAERAADALEEALNRRTDLFTGDLFISVSRPDGSIFFRRNAFLFLPVAEVHDVTERIVQAQPLLGTLAADPSLRGLATSFGLVLQGVERGEAKLADFATALDALLPPAEAALDNRLQFLDWGELFTGRKPTVLETRRFVLAKPRLDFAALSPGAKAGEVIRNTARELGLTPEHGVRVRLTGQVVMADEEFATVAEGAVRNTLLSLALVSLLLWLALHSLRLILPVLATLMLGLVITAAFGVVAIGPYNPLSIAFAVLFIGLGVDFGIQFAMRYREQRFLLDHRKGPKVPAGAELRTTLTAAAGVAGPGILLAAAAIAGAFFAFLPTDYRGVSELGAIAGFGMAVAALLSLTVLPAMICWTEPPGERAEIGWAFLEGLENRLAWRARRYVWVIAALAVAALTTLPALRFDFNPLNLRDPRAESVATFRDLMKSPQTTPNTLSVLVPSLEAARPLSDRLEALPEVASAMTLADFVPDDQTAKLGLIQDAADLLGPTLSPDQVKPPPDDHAVAEALHQFAADLTRVAKGSTAEEVKARRLAAALDRLAQGSAEQRRTFAEAVVPGLKTTLAQLRDALMAQPVTLATLPDELRRDWIAPDGRARIEIHPRGLYDDNEAMRRFALAVQSVAPQASGPAISIQASSTTIRQAFLLAGGIGLALTLALLLAALRNLRLALLAMAPLLLAGLLTLATCTLVGPVLNLANIIALPLLFGIGVAFDIYYVVAWRNGERRLLPSPLTRAVLFSALTTASAFGTLALSNHPGTASMGELLAISLLYLLASVLLALPVLLHAFGGNGVSSGKGA